MNHLTYSHITQVPLPSHKPQGIGRSQKKGRKTFDSSILCPVDVRPFLQAGVKSQHCSLFDSPSPDSLLLEVQLLPAQPSSNRCEDEDSRRQCLTGPAESLGGGTPPGTADAAPSLFPPLWRESSDGAERAAVGVFLSISGPLLQDGSRQASVFLSLGLTSLPHWPRHMVTQKHENQQVVPCTFSLSSLPSSGL